MENDKWKMTNGKWQIENNNKSRITIENNKSEIVPASMPSAFAALS